MRRRRPRHRPRPAPRPDRDARQRPVNLGWSAPPTTSASRSTGYEVCQGTSAGCGTHPSRRLRDDLHEHEPHQRHDLLLPVTRRGRRSATAAPRPRRVRRRSPPDTVPEPPTGLTATPGNEPDQSGLERASDNVGVTISGSRSAGDERGLRGHDTRRARLPGRPSRTRASANGTIYYYTVKAVNRSATLMPRPRRVRRHSSRPSRSTSRSCNNGSVGGLSVANEDVVAYNGTTFGLAFDGSDVGLGSRTYRRLQLVEPDHPAVLPRHGRRHAAGCRGHDRRLGRHPLRRHLARARRRAERSACTSTAPTSV